MNSFQSTRALLLSFVLGTLCGSAASAKVMIGDPGDRPLPTTLEEAQAWWTAGLDAKPFSESKPFVPETKPFVMVAPRSETPAVAAKINPIEKRKKRLLEGAGRLIVRLKLPLQVGGYTTTLRHDEEYKLYKSADDSKATIVFSDAFWNEFFRYTDTDANHYDYSTYLTYVLIRAGADFDYRKSFDPERLAWTVQGDAETLAPSLRVLRQTIEAPNTSWIAPDGPVYKIDEDFRRSVDPEGNPAKTLQALVRHALGALAQRAADRYALEEYARVVGESPTRAIRKRVRQNERVLSWEFGRARAAMNMAERMAFRKALQSSFGVYSLPVVEAAAVPAAAVPNDPLLAAEP
jgi:hypothetical protein